MLHLCALVVVGLEVSRVGDLLGQAVCGVLMPKFLLGVVQRLTQQVFHPPMLLPICWGLTTTTALLLFSL